MIDEVPAVGFNFWSDRTVFHESVVNDITLKNHMQQVNEMIERDRNHPSVVIYSLANEANTHEEGAYPYFKKLVDFTRNLTDTPLMIVEWVDASINKVASLFDIIGVNRYFGWYTDFADLEVIERQLKESLIKYHERFHKPILLSEFGADTIAGIHTLPSLAFSEEFQIEFIEKYQKAIANLEFIVGEHVWNFSDFMTKPGLTRFVGNRKGIFTRDRQPKMIAHYLREHWKQ
jgi:beta-glucuronidase